MEIKPYILSSILVATGFFTSGAQSESSAGPLFDSHSVLELSMKVDFNKLCRPREDPDCDYSPTEMVYQDGGKERIIPIEIRIRGGWRSLAKNCNVPLLFIRFPGQASRGTPFEGQSNLPLTTHCGRTSSLRDQAGSTKYYTYEQYLLKEYLAYRLYNEMPAMGLHVRLARIRYENPDFPDRGDTKYAFFTEHFNSLAERSHVELLPRGDFDHQLIDAKTADMVALFQFMIGNTDWSIVRQRNTLLVQPADGPQVPVPYDLDMSGLVNAPYAGPPPTLPIDKVTERYYLGFCHPDIDWDALFQEFLSRRVTLLSLVDEVPGLYKREQSKAERFLKKFFAILESPEKSKDKIINACQPWPPAPEDHMTPEEQRK
jgi:hypothetical protein